MSATTNARIKFKRDTKANWNAARGMIPLDGEVIIYSDYRQIQKEIDGQLRNVYLPGVKIGDGQTYVQDLPFVDEELREMIINHINNQDIHVSIREKLFWNNKLNVDDAYEQEHDELVNETLVLNRD